MKGSGTEGTSSDPALGKTVDERGATVALDALPKWLGERYRILRVLGQGGMGAVYLAVDEALVCEVALKVLALELAGSAQGLERLRDEVRLAQKVTHPNVCRTYDLEDVGGSWLIKMEYVAGETLAERLKRRQLPVAQAVQITREICGGLAAAHRQGVVHRDLKPHNIMLEAQTGRVVLMDFGIARAAALAGKTAENVSGTPDYMAPEQVRGREVDGRADLYALGCVLYEMVVGERVFPRPTPMASALAHAEEPTPALPAKVPKRLRLLLARLLEKDPARRPKSAEEVVAELVGSSSRRGLWILAAAGAVAAGAALILWRQPARQVWRAEIRDLPSYDENSDSPRFSPDGAQIAFMSDREEPNHFRIYVVPVSGSPARAVSPSDLNVGYPSWTLDGKSLLFYEPNSVSSGRGFRTAVDGGVPEKIAENIGGLEDCHGRLLLVYGNSPGCSTCNRIALRETGGAERDLVRFTADEWVGNVRCDRVGQRAVYVHSGAQGRAGAAFTDLWLLALDGGVPRRLTSDPAGDQYPTFTADGRSIVFSSRRSGTTHLFEMPSDGSVNPVQLTFGAGPDLAPDVAPDGRSVIFDEDSSLVTLFAQPIAGGARRKITAKVQDLAWPQPTPDGRAVIAGAVAPSGQAQIVSIPLDGGEPVLLVDGTTPALSPDGSEVVYSERATGHVRAIPRTGGPSRPVTEAPGTVVRIDVRRDGMVGLMVVRVQGIEAWVAPLYGGAAAREAPEPWARIGEAPAGGWRTATRRRDRGWHIRFVPPGAPLDDPRALELDICHYATWMPDGKSYVYTDCDGHVRRFWVETRDDKVLMSADPDSGLAVSPDGQTLYTTEAVGHARRELITNFAERPPL